jgi:hypothetical protein
LYGGAHLWNSTHTLSLKNRTDKFNLKQDFGLDKLEKTSEGLEFRWTKRSGGVTLNVAKPMIKIPLLASHPDIRENAVRVKIFLIKNFFKQKRLLDEIVLRSPEWKTFGYDLSGELNERVILLFKVSRTWNPQKELGIRDSRNLGVAIGKIEFEDSRLSIFEIINPYIYDGNDFNGDGLTEISVWRPTNGYWYIRNGDLKQWGTSGDIPCPGDFDGDGTTDLAIWRPSNGCWYVKDQFITPWGTNGDIPVPGDYDGDKKTDIAVWRPSSGQWFIQKSGGGISIIQWGAAGDIPVPGDYDGDKKTDIAVWRPPSGQWFIQKSGRDISVIQWGAAGDIPVPGDYDGDKKTDIAVWRPPSGQWFIQKSAGRMELIQWGKDGDIPTPGDYDGRGRTEIAVFRPANGLWFVKDQMVIPWGASGDVPLVR